MLLSPSDVLFMGLKYIGVRPFQQEGLSEFTKQTYFGAHFGSSSLCLADMWYDMQAADVPGARLSVAENSEKGFKGLLMAHFFLWTYPKNAMLLMSRFGVCERYCRGEPLWHWVKKIQALKERKIRWDPGLGDPDSSPFIGTIDGTDCKIWEPKHPTMNLDKTYCSQKFKHAGLKYELVMSLLDGRCMWINGPFICGMHDLTVFRQGLKDVMRGWRGKMLIGDKAYKPGDAFPDEFGMFAPPSRLDSVLYARWKSRARCRHETFNGRLKNFQILSETFRGTDLRKHMAAFEAVAVIVQYQMDNGSPVFTM
jgi:hypothetical protein